MFYTAQTALAYSVGSVAGGLANNSMTTAQRAALSPSSTEYHNRYANDLAPKPNITLEAVTNMIKLIRVIGSKIQIAGWSTYVALINSLKLSMLAFYIRLMVCSSHTRFNETNYFKLQSTS